VTNSVDRTQWTDQCANVHPRVDRPVPTSGPTSARSQCPDQWNGILRSDIGANVFIRWWTDQCSTSAPDQCLTSE
jgi:hypothetical protein